jgi:hypothetical protein
MPADSFWKAGTLPASDNGHLARRIATEATSWKLVDQSLSRTRKWLEA